MTIFNMFSKNKVKITILIAISMLAIGFFYGVLSAKPAEAAVCDVRINSPLDGTTVSADSSLPISVYMDCSSPYRIYKFQYAINSVTISSSKYSHVPAISIDYGNTSLPAIPASAIKTIADKIPGQYASLVVTFFACTNDNIEKGTCGSNYIAIDKSVAIKFPVKATPPTTNPELKAWCAASPNPAQIGETVLYTGYASGGSGSYTYSWSGAISGASYRISKSFSQAGDYTAYLVVKDSNGNQKQTSCYTTVKQATIPTPTLQVSCYASPNPAQTCDIVRFTATASGGKGTYRYSWSGAISGSTQSVSKNFPQAGSYVAYILVSDDDGNQKQASCSVLVNQQQNPVTRYSCDTSTRQCYYDENGWYTSLSSCNLSCQPTQPPVYGYNCNSSTGQCTYAQNGSYSTLAACQSACQLPSPQYGYNCNISSKQCSYAQNGSYSTLAACQAVCDPVIPTTKYSCNQLTYQCVTDTNGAYTDLNTCQNNCKTPTTRYSCNSSTWQCIPDSNGAYTDLNICQSSCRQTINPPTVIINANPSVIDRGQTSILTWSSSNASTCTAYSNWSGYKNLYGQESVNPYQTSTYSITCYNTAGASATASTVVSVRDSSPTVDITVYPSTIYRGQTAMLSWSSQNAYNCQGSSTNNIWTGYKSNSGSEQTSPSYTTTYTITCQGNNGGTVSDWVTLNVNDSTSQTLTLNKLGRNLSGGDNSYRKVIRVSAGDVIEFYLQVDNLTGYQSLNTTIIDTLPVQLSYRAGTTKVDNVSWQDGITSSGLNLGTLNSGGKRVITFQAIANASTYLFTVTNTASVRSDNNSLVTDSATVTYSAVAGAATVNTGPTETMLMILAGTSSVTAGAWYFLKKTKKGQALWEKVQDSAIKNQINKFRVR